MRANRILMTRFEEMSQRINLLNGQLETLEQSIGSEARKILYTRLWGIVAELDTLLNLGLENTALDLTVEGDRFVIHYWSGVNESAQEIHTFIDRSFKVFTQKRNLATGELELT